MKSLPGKSRWDNVELQHRIQRAERLAIRRTAAAIEALLRDDATFTLETLAVGLLPPGGWYGWHGSVFTRHGWLQAVNGRTPAELLIELRRRRVEGLLAVEGPDLVREMATEPAWRCVNGELVGRRLSRNQIAQLMKEPAAKVEGKDAAEIVRRLSGIR